MDDFHWAVRKATAKKREDFSKVEFFSYDEGLCVQCMHIGLYDDLSDARKVAPERLKTVIRHPIRRA